MSIMAKRVLLYVYLCAYICIYATTVKDYGAFKLKINEFIICKGPKRVDCSTMTTNIENDVNLILNITVKQNCIPTKGKITATMNNKPLVRLQMNNPCDHLFMKPLFQAILNVSQNCEFVKGQYLLNIDIEKVAQNYYGGMFLYGNMTFKSIFYSDHCNFSCGVIHVNFSPKNETKP